MLKGSRKRQNNQPERGENYEEVYEAAGGRVFQRPSLLKKALGGRKLPPTFFLIAAGLLRVRPFW